MAKKIPPPNSHRVRGLLLNKLQPEMKDEVKTIAKIVMQSDGRLDMQIRDSYINVYYRGGCIWKVSHISPMSRGIIIETDKKYFEIDRNKTIDSSWLPDRKDGIGAWNRVRDRHMTVMEDWFCNNPKAERDLQHVLACNHLKNHSSKWIILDIEYAAWLHGTKENKKAGDCRRLCQYDMIGIKRQSLSDDNPIPVYIMELKLGDAAIGGKSGIISHAEDIAQLLSDMRDKKALMAFKESIQNIIREKAEIGILPGVSTKIVDRDIEPRVAFILQDSNEIVKEKKAAQKILSRCCDRILWITDYKKMLD